MRNIQNTNAAANVANDSSNPVFKYSITTPTDTLEQPNSTNKQISQGDSEKFKLGDTITGKSIQDNKIITGQIISIKKDGDNDDGYITVLSNKTQSKIKLIPSSCTKTNNESLEFKTFKDFL